MKSIKAIIYAALSIALIFQHQLSMAQAPEKISYQLIIRDASGELVRSQQVGMQISIIQGATDGASVYIETHSPTTNINGLATLEVGNGTPLSGSFSSIDWSNSPYFLKVDTDPTGGTTYTISGTSEILSTPYALHAKSVKGTIDADNSVVSNVADPINAQDAATKAYVDALIEESLILYNGFTDTRDNTHYNAVKIGNQVWMSENLKYLPSVNPTSAESDTDPYYYIYNYQGTSVSEATATANYTTYGVLYNWPAATTACPSGWHLPSDAEWTELTTYLGGTAVSGGKLKETGTTHWNSPNTGATNETDFTALPGGYRNDIETFYDISYGGYWWSATESSSADAYYRYMSYDLSSVFRIYFNKEKGFSIRCVKD